MALKALRIALAMGVCVCSVSAQAQPSAAPGAAAGGPGSAFDLAFWQAIAASNDPALFQAYLDQFPGGTFAVIARARVARKDASPAPQSATAPVATPPAAAPQPLDMPPAVPALPSAPLIVAAGSPAAPGQSAAVTAALAAMHVADAARAAAAQATQSVSGPATPVAVAPIVVAAAQPAPTVAAAPLAMPVLVAAEAPPVPRLAAATMPALEQLAAMQVTPPAPPAPRFTPPLPPVPTPALPGRRAARPMVQPAVYSAPVRRPVLSTAATSPAMADVVSALAPTGNAFGTLLTQMAYGQQTPGSAQAMDEAMDLPLRPQFMAVPQVALPDAFCSMEQRNAFHEGVYAPAVAVAQRNNQAAVAYIQRLQALYDSYQLGGDTRTLQAIAAEARDFQQQAAIAYSVQDTLVHQFENLMAVPVRACGAVQ